MDSSRIRLNLADSDSEEDVGPANRNSSSIANSSGLSWISSTIQTPTISVPAGMPRLFLYRMRKNYFFTFPVALESNKASDVVALFTNYLDDTESTTHQSPAIPSLSRPVSNTVERLIAPQLGMVSGYANPSVPKGPSIKIPSPPSAPSYEVPVRQNPPNATIGIRRYPIQQPTVSCIYICYNIFLNE